MTDEEIRELQCTAALIRVGSNIWPSSAADAFWRLGKAVEQLLDERDEARKATEGAIRGGGCRGCAQDAIGPDGTAKHTCDAGLRHVENYENLVCAISALTAERDALRAKLEEAKSALTWYKRECLVSQTDGHAGAAYVLWKDAGGQASAALERLEKP